MTNEERIQRESNLIATIRKKLPDFARMCADDAEHVLFHQDAFAADYQEDEYILLGMAIKYAGLRGKEVRVIGKNRSTLGEEDSIPLPRFQSILLCSRATMLIDGITSNLVRHRRDCQFYQYEPPGLPH